MAGQGGMMVQLLPMLLLAADLLDLCRGACPADYKLNPNTGLCYRHHTPPLDFWSAEMACNSRGEGGTLMKVTDGAAPDWLRTDGVVPFDSITQGHLFWIGVNDIQTNLQYQYNDGSAVDTYAPWNTGSSAAPSLGCVTMQLGAAQQHEWREDDCTQTHTAICQLPQDAGEAAVKMQTFVAGPDASSSKWLTISTHNVVSTIECSVLCVTDNSCGAVMVQVSEGVTTCDLMKPEMTETLVVPTGATLYQWVPK